MFGLLLGTELVGEAGLQLDSNCRVVCVAIGQGAVLAVESRRTAGGICCSAKWGRVSKIATTDTGDSLKGVLMNSRLASLAHGSGLYCSGTSVRRGSGDRVRSSSVVVQGYG